MCVFSWIQFTKYLIEFVFVDTNQLFGSDSNVILTRQTCGQRSGMAAASNHRALAFDFFVRICYKFLISKCTGESDLGLCTTSWISKRMPLRSADFPRNPAWAMAAGLPRQDRQDLVWITMNHFVRSHKDEFDEMPCKLDSTKFVRSFEPNPTLPLGRVGFCSNERAYLVESSLQSISSNSSLWKRTKWFIVSKRDFDAANLQPASSRVAGSRALAFDFSISIWYVVLLSKC